MDTVEVNFCASVDVCATIPSANLRRAHRSARSAVGVRCPVHIFSEIQASCVEVEIARVNGVVKTPAICGSYLRARLELDTLSTVLN